MSKTVTVPDSVELECEFKGVPRPLVTWSAILANNETKTTGWRITTGERAVEGQPVLVSTLTLSSTTVEDDGEYTCLGDNGLTSSSAAATLTVICKEYIVC